MAFVKDNLPWIASSAALAIVASSYFDIGPRSDSAPVATQPTATAPADLAAAAAQTAVQAPGAAIAAAPVPSAAEQLSAIVKAATETAEPQVSRGAVMDTSVAPIAAAPVAPAPQAPAVVDSTIRTDPTTFFAEAQANLQANEYCGDDLRALATEARIYFPTGGVAADDSGLAQARLLAQVMGKCPGYVVQVEGHSDRSGDSRANLALSQRRAEAVVARLAASGFDTANFIARGMGDAQPSNIRGPEPAAFYDRRVEFVVVKQDQVAALSAAPAAWRADNCSTDLEAFAAQTRLFYAPNAITVQAAELETVRTLASKVASCENARLRIVGQHTADPSARETPATGRLRALAVMNTLVAAGFSTDQILISAPSWADSIPGQPGLPNSRVDFDIVIDPS